MTTNNILFSKLRGFTFKKSFLISQDQTILLDGFPIHTDVQPKVHFFRKFLEIQGRIFSIERNYFDFMDNF